MIQSVSTDGPTLLAEIEEASLQPLWDRYEQVVSPAPRRHELSHQWCWRQMQPIIERAAREVPMADAERRVLMLANPAFDGRPVTTMNLFAGLQILEAGECARLHRHSAAALRFVLSGSGAVTYVNGEACAMAEGDLILTPPWAWHEHVNDGPDRVVWFDGLDLPLSGGFDAVFAESGSTLTEDGARPDRVELARLPVGVQQRADDSSVYRFSWAETRRALGERPALADGSRVQRYVDPLTGSAVMPTLDCEALALAPNQPTRPRRSTASVVCVVISGTGESTVGDRLIKWNPHDIFTLPHWQWVSHVAKTPEAFIFTMSDREVFRRLGLLREEVHS